jgi:hypothetical protein
VFFTLACALSAAIMFMEDSRRHSVLRLFTVPVATWLVILACVCPTVRICGIGVDALVRGLELVLSKVENIHYVLIGTSRGLRCAPFGRLSKCVGQQVDARV